MTDSPFRMTISLNVLNHLGIGLYSNFPAVLSEMVANAWDADAGLVEIDIDPEAGTIEVRDDGHGMSVEDINAKFLTVGYRRRDASPTTPGGRTVMGRKGLGKLAAFSVADTVEVHTSNGQQASALRMDANEIEAHAASGHKGDYRPTAIAAEMDAGEQGTLIRLTNLRRSPSKTAKHLRRRLARRFGVIGSHTGFSVQVDGAPIGIEDRDYFGAMEFIWHFGKPARGWDFSKAPSGTDSGTVLSEVRLPTPDRSGTQLRHVRGFIGTVRKPSDLDDVNNAVVLSARGRLIHEDMLPEYRQARMYTEYIVGEVVADFLDADDREDIVTSGRQRVQQDDPRYAAVTKTVHAALNRIRDEWSERRRKRGAQRALEYPIVQRWYERMGPDSRATAKRMFGKIEALRVDDPAAKYQLYRASILAFEKLALKDMLDALEGIDTRRDFETLARLMSGVDELEATNYREIVEGRLAVIRKLRGVMHDALEKVLQQHFFDHPWLLHPSWERAAVTPHLEKTVSAEFRDINASLTKEERRGRIDLRFQSVPGRHVIVELKRYNRRVAAVDLVKQLQKYRTALAKCLATKFPGEPQAIECVAVLGQAPTPEDDHETNRRILDAINARYVTYDELVAHADASYQEYLKSKAEAVDLDQLLTDMRADFGLVG